MVTLCVYTITPLAWLHLMLGNTELATILYILYYIICMTHVDLYDHSILYNVCISHSPECA